MRHHVGRLTEVFRQAANSRILTNAHRINEGQMPNLTAREADGDFFFVERQVTVRFERREVVYELGELDEVSLACAITIHKSQGSEFPAVVIPLATQHCLLLQRNLVYTRIIRGKGLGVGQRKAVAIAVRNNKTESRFFGLLLRLRVSG